VVTMQTLMPEPRLDSLLRQSRVWSVLTAKMSPTAILSVPSTLLKLLELRPAAQTMEGAG
jgi:hypothetical protein